MQTVERVVLTITLCQTILLPNCWTVSIPLAAECRFASVFAQNDAFYLVRILLEIKRNRRRLGGAIVSQSTIEALLISSVLRVPELNAAIWLEFGCACYLIKFEIQIISSV